MTDLWKRSLITPERMHVIICKITAMYQHKPTWTQWRNTTCVFLHSVTAVLYAVCCSLHLTTSARWIHTGTGPCLPAAHWLPPAWKQLQRSHKATQQRDPQPAAAQVVLAANGRGCCQSPRLPGHGRAAEASAMVKRICAPRTGRCNVMSGSCFGLKCAAEWMRRGKWVSRRVPAQCVWPLKAWCRGN